MCEQTMSFSYLEGPRRCFMESFGGLGTSTRVSSSSGGMVSPVCNANAEQVPLKFPGLKTDILRALPSVLHILEMGTGEAGEVSGELSHARVSILSPQTVPT